MLCICFTVGRKVKAKLVTYATEWCYSGYSICLHRVGDLHGWFKLPVAVKVMIWCERLTNIEVLSQLMRGLMIAIMMLLLPLASAISSPTETIIYEPDSRNDCLR